MQEGKWTNHTETLQQGESLEKDIEKQVTSKYRLIYVILDLELNKTSRLLRDTNTILKLWMGMTKLVT